MRYAQLGLRLAADIYASRAHFVLELLQNADDNEYAPGAVPRVGHQCRKNRSVFG